MSEQEKQQLVEAVITQLKNDGTDVSSATVVEDISGVSYVLCYDTNGNIVRSSPNTINQQERTNKNAIEALNVRVATLGTDLVNTNNDLTETKKNIASSLHAFSGTNSVNITGKSNVGRTTFYVDIPNATTEAAGVMTATDKKKLDELAGIASGAIKITWDANSNMNDYTKAGIYDIYGERTNSNDNVPITQAYNGASIAARLTVVASTLQPDNTEKCITQFLQLSNRMGGEGNTYIRTYNENNNGLNGWSEWKKQQGMVESYINTDAIGITANSVQTIGLNGMTENGMYSGIYTDDLSLQAPTFVETFVLVVINDYAVSSKAGTPRRISQLKYATDTLTGQCTVKKRVGTGDDSISWGNWEEIGGGGSSEVDITDAVKAYGLPTLIAQGFAKEGVTYKIVIPNENPDPFRDGKIDVNNAILRKLVSFAGGVDAKFLLLMKVLSTPSGYKRIIIDSYEDNPTGDEGYLRHYRFIMSEQCSRVQVSADMTEL